ncbi:phenylacetate--CoA ligase family protein [Bradyrhizobium lablabi]|uniref:phenylacetate--CoA ligase family protein n=1 Tax=Bradyrhizobium lablabi TaxID=722472 RepID=UPI000909AACC|nr:AMP-binding protein [Bradyrhizobium lablabi]SHM82071.1 Phenylacetate-coenzyme A ligase PaaK, adenylate-forming domain family [Bradyrhizobium lablabi]
MTPYPYRDTSAEQQKQISLSRLLNYITDVVYPYSPYYRRVLREHAVDPAALRTYDDFCRAVPLTFKEDIVANLAEFTVAPSYPGRTSEFDVEPLRASHWEAYRQAARNPGARDIFGLRSEEERIREQYLFEWQPVHFQMSGGSTGRAITTGYTVHDLGLLGRSAAWLYQINGLVAPEDVWLNLLPAAPHLGIYAALLIPLMNGQPNMNTFGGKVMPTERQIEIAAEMGCSAILALPSYLTHWLRTAKRMLDEGRIKPLGKIKLAMCVGEPLTEPYRNLLKDLFASVGCENVSVLEGMSSTELRAGGFFECSEGSKLHFDPEYFYPEILHPETREPVPPGEPGVFAWSHIDWRGTAILRYWTGDYVSGGMVWGECPHCKLTLPRLRTPIWRVERDFTKIRGTRVEYVALQDAVRSVPGIRTYQIIIRKQEPDDPVSRDLLDIYVAVDRHSNEEALARLIQNALKIQIELRPDSIIFESVDQIEAKLFAKKLKAEWIIDQRPQLIDIANSAPANT